MNRYLMSAAAPALLASSLLAAPGLALAQDDAQSSVLEEVVVTATRREERLQDVPVAVTALGGQTLEQRSIATVGELQRVAPSLVVRNFPGDNTSASITLRGLGSSENLISIDPTVGIYLDGVYIGRATGGNLGMLDVARVEVLRGPQGTLFGRNTIGGAVSIVSNLPSQQLGGYIGAGVGNYGLWQVEGVANVPINDRLAFRIAVRHSEHRGYAESSVTGADLNADDSNYVRASLRFEATPDLEIVLGGDYSHTENDGQWVTLLAVNPLGSFAREAALTGIVPVIDPFTKRPPSADTRGPFTGQVWGVNGTATWKVGPGTVKSITAYREMVRDNRNNDLDGTPAVGIRQFIGYADQKQFSEELQYYGNSLDGRLDWIFGGYYFRESGFDLSRSSFLPLLTDFGGRGCPGGPGVLDNCPSAHSITHGRAVNKSASAFAQVGFALTEQLKLNAGIRYVEDRRALTLWSRGVKPTAPVVVNFSEVSDILSCTTAASIPAANCFTKVPSSKFDYIPFMVGLDYKPMEDVLLYGKFSRGFRSGGFNIRGTTSGALAPFGPEEANTVELGFKSELLDRRLRLNAAAYSTKYKDIQLSAVIPAPPPALTTSTTKNAGEAKIKGVEVETTLRLGQLTLNAAGAYTDAKYTKLLSGISPADVTLASAVPATPEWVLSLSADYIIPLGEDKLTLNAGWDWRDDVVFVTVPPRHPSNSQEAFGLLSARATYAMANGVELSAWGTNLADEEYIYQTTDQFASLGYVPGFPGAPRTYGVTVKYRFGER